MAYKEQNIPMLEHPNQFQEIQVFQKLKYTQLHKHFVENQNPYTQHITMILSLSRLFRYEQWTTKTTFDKID